MCIGVPSQVLETDGEEATVDVGGVRRTISVMLLTGVNAGDWVILHAGFAIEKIDPDEAAKTLALLREFADASEVS